MMKSILWSSLVLSAVICTDPSFADAKGKGRKWSDDNSPAILNTQYRYQIDKLPLAGSMDLTKRGWSDTYWPLEKGMIAYRWQVPNSDFKKDKAPDASHLSSMSASQLNLLSPAEKYDLARGDYAFTLSKSIRDDNSGHEREWRGICNGWTVASLNMDEPKPTIFKNKDGLKIPFGASDIKALLAYYYAKIDDSNTVIVGKRCRMKPAMSWASNACGNDLNAGTFHVIMANELGINHKGFAADRDPFNEIWNQPFVKFESHVVSELSILKGQKLSKDASKEAVREITMSSDLYYADDEDVISSIDPYISAGTNKITKTTYNYVLEVNGYGNVIGGDWLDGPRPDFIWRQMFNKPVGEHKLIQTIYDQSQK